MNEVVERVTEAQRAAERTNEDNMRRLLGRHLVATGSAMPNHALTFNKWVTNMRLRLIYWSPGPHP